MKGITTPCCNRKCRKPLFTHFNAQGSGSFYTDCKECGKRNEVIFEQHTVITVKPVGKVEKTCLIILLALIGFSFFHIMTNPQPSVLTSIEEQE